MLRNPPYFKKWWNTIFNAATAHYGLIGPILISPVILPDFRSSLISLWLVSFKYKIVMDILISGK